MLVSRWTYTVVAAGWLVLTAGCVSGQAGTDTHQQLVPADFAAGAPVSTGPSVPVSDTPSPAVSENNREDEVSAATASEGQHDTEASSNAVVNSLPKPHVDLTVFGDMPLYTVDAMVGQVNGKPIYASTVFESIFEQLAALGRSLPRAEFRQRAGQLIEARLGQIVTDALILGEAESSR